MTSLILPADGTEGVVPGAAGSLALVSCAAPLPVLASVVGPPAPNAPGVGGFLASGVSTAAALPVWASAVRPPTLGWSLALGLCPWNGDGTAMGPSAVSAVAMPVCVAEVWRSCAVLSRSCCSRLCALSYTCANGCRLRNGAREQSACSGGAQHMHKVPLMPSTRTRSTYH